MAIDINKLNSGALRPVATPVKHNPAQTSQSADKPATDAVVLTAQAQQLQKAESVAQTASGVNEAKVAELKQAISEGRYHVDPEKLAANIGRFENELTGLLDD